MKKSILTAMVIGVITSLVATPVFADDPPDLEVDVNVVTPGDAGLNVDIDAGGDVDVTVDGVDFKDTAATAQAAYDKVFTHIITPWPSMSINEYKYLWNASGLNSSVSSSVNVLQSQLYELQNISSLLAEAEARLISEQGKLIAGQELNEEEIAEINTVLSSLDDAFNSSNADISFNIKGLQDREKIIWNQLMYGAEYHISLLDEELTTQGALITSLQEQVDTLTSEVDAINADYLAFMDDTEEVQERHLYHLYATGAAIVLLAIALVLVWVSLKRKVVAW
jgi:hypothetical protein